MTAFVSLIITVFVQVFYLLFKIAQKCKLTLPLVYLLIATISTFFSRWVPEHESLVLIGLYILIGMTILRWIYVLIQKVQSV